MTALIHHSSETNEHFTPELVVTPARRLLRRFDLDPASCPRANKQVLAVKFFTKREDGLRQHWRGRVFLNPPGGKIRRDGDRWVPTSSKGFGESSMKIWWNRLATAWQSGSVTEAFFVGFTLEILRSSQACVLPVQHFPRCYPSERLHFGGEAPTHGNVLVYLPRVGDRDAVKRFRKLFGDVGLVEPGVGVK